MLGAALPGLLFVILAIALVLAARRRRASRVAPRLAVLFGARASWFPGTFTIDAAGIVAAGRDDELGEVALSMLITEDGTAHGTFTLGGHRWPLAGDAAPCGFRAPDRRPRRAEVPIAGVRFHFYQPLAGPIVRERHAALGSERQGLFAELVALFPEPDAAEPPLTAEEAVATVLDRVRTTWPEAGARARGELEVTIDTGVFSLRNLWPEIAALPESQGRRRILALVDGVVRAHRAKATWTNRADRLVVRLSAAPFPNVAHVRLADGLVASFAQDLSETLRWLPEDELAALGLPDPLSLAAANVYRMQPVIRVRGDAPLFEIVCDGTFEAALLVVPEVVAAMESLVDGPLLVHVPARHRLLFTGDAGPERRAALVHGGRPLAYPISSRLFRRERGGWVAVE